jgi:hypothetical protein
MAAPYRFSEAVWDFEVFGLTRSRQAEGSSRRSKTNGAGGDYFAPFGTLKQYMRSSFDFTHAGVV